MPDPLATEKAVPQPRKRAAGACQACHARKVRCSLAHTGSPCINCSLDRVTCVSRVPEKRRTRQHRTLLRSRGSNPTSNHTQHHSQVENENATRQDQDAQTTLPSATETANHPTVADSTSSGTAVTPITETGNASGNEPPYQPFAEHFSLYGGQGDSGTAQGNENGLESHYAPLYGDPRGIALVADICEPQRRNKSGHIFVPRIRPPNVDPETLEYLNARGVFDVPPKEACELMVRDYFCHVHPFFPVVGVGEFVERFEEWEWDEGRGVSVMLLWSLFVAASNFADEDTLRATGFPSRKEMKRSMYTKAKALYDAEYERNKITLIQSVLLLGFWYADSEDRTGPWHWNGVAISLCQTIGLHRNPDPTSSSIVRPNSTTSTNTNAHTHTSVLDRKLWRQLWWCCVYRETWFSAGMGRPMRIRLEDCNTTMPDNDVGERLSKLPTKLRDKYFPEGMQAISHLWIRLLKLTVILSELLVLQQRADRVLPTEPEVKKTEQRIRECAGHEQGKNVENALDVDARNDLVTLYTYHFEIYVESVTLTLYRPFLLPDSTERFSQNWTWTVEQKTRAAAMTTNRLLSNIIRADMLHLCQSIICIALVPTLQIHLLDSTSAKPAIRRMAHQHLDLCMIVVEELRKTFFGAEILYRMFTKAQKQIREKRMGAGAGAGSATDAEVGLDSEGQVQVSLEGAGLGDGGFGSADVEIGQGGEGELDALLAMWNSGAPLMGYEGFGWDDSE